ncbi:MULTISPECIES: RNA polymerase sigma factor [Niastella]|uniref:RNA polymerase sigma-70 factor n=1 Tax=Niastella soli TaxID=2821487 RepID=A0ABS3YQ14_9BACT|nr:RNA polymerase sigma-70 factor [Niastella soli]MBO9199996.1 RNA polymerase sigma-70 factor [Niastella soli]
MNDQVLHRNDHNEEHSLELLFADLFKKHEYRLHTLVLKLTRSNQYASDIIQEVFLKLWEHRYQIHTIQNVEAWLYRLTENKVIDFLRKAAADSRLKESIWKNQPDNLNETVGHVEAREYSQIIQKAVDELPPQRKLIYQLNREKGLNYQEIADRLAISKHTVKNQLSTALQSIRLFLQKSARLFLPFF